MSEERGEISVKRQSQRTKQNFSGDNDASKVGSEHENVGDGKFRGEDGPQERTDLPQAIMDGIKFLDFDDITEIEKPGADKGKTLIEKLKPYLSADWKAANEKLMTDNSKEITKLYEKSEEVEAFKLAMEKIDKFGPEKLVEELQKQGETGQQALLKAWIDRNKEMVGSSFTLENFQTEKRGLHNLFIEERDKAAGLNNESEISAADAADAAAVAAAAADAAAAVSMGRN